MSRKLNIAIVANTAFNLYNFRLGLIRALKQEGHRVLAIAPEDEYTGLLRAEGIEFTALKHLARKGTNPLHDLRLMWEFRTIYQSQHIDVALQYTIKPNIYGTLGARLSGTKAVCTVTGLGYTFLNRSLASAVAHRLYRLAFASAYRVLFQNEDDLQTFLEDKLVDKSRTMLVPGSGIDTTYFHPSFCTPEPGKDKLHFLMIGRLLKDKGVCEYAAAARAILDKGLAAEFHLLGEIDKDNPSAISEETLKQWTAGNILLHHPHTRDTRPLICAADCIVLPSYREGMPRVILEGMAMARPCIATEAPGCRDAVEEEASGFLCEVADAASLQAAMERFLALSAQERIQMGKRARQRVEQYFSSSIVNYSYITLLRNLPPD